AFVRSPVTVLPQAQAISKGGGGALTRPRKRPSATVSHRLIIPRGSSEQTPASAARRRCRNSWNHRDSAPSNHKINYTELALPATVGMVSQDSSGAAEIAGDVLRSWTRRPWDHPRRPISISSARLSSLATSELPVQPAGAA